MQPRKQRNANTIAKLACAVFVLAFYILYSAFHSYPSRTSQSKNIPKLDIQHKFVNGTGAREPWKLDRVQRAMRITYTSYIERASSHDEIKPITGGTRRSRNAWGVFLVDAASTFALMSMTGDVQFVVNHIVHKINFNSPMGLVDTRETTTRYLGGVLSLVDLFDNGVINISPAMREDLIDQAKVLADQLLHAYDTPSGLPWPNVDFVRHVGARLEGDDDPLKTPIINLAEGGTNILENCVLSNLTLNSKYCQFATKGWSRLVWSRYKSSLPGLLDGPVEVMTGTPAGREASWDQGQNTYYEYLLKASILFPSSSHSQTYGNRFLAAAEAVRWNLTSRSAPSEKDWKSHLYLGRRDGPWFINSQTAAGCAAPGHLMLASKAFNKPDLMRLGAALLEGCRHVYSSTPTGLGPEAWSWPISDSDKNHASSIFYGQDKLVAFQPMTKAQHKQIADRGFWITDARYRLRPEYMESLFYAYRITGEQRYRDWAWEAFEAIELHAKAQFGFATVKDVLAANAKDVERLDEQDTWFVAATLKYAYLIFDDHHKFRLEDWVFNAQGHPLRRRA